MFHQCVHGRTGCPEDTSVSYTDSTAFESLLRAGGGVPVPALTAVCRDCLCLLCSGHMSTVNEVQWHPQEPTQLFSCSDDHTVCIWSP